MKKPLISFDMSSLDFVLKLFDIKQDSKGFLTRYGEPAPTLDGKPMKAKELAGIINTDGGLRLIRNNIVDLIEFADRY